jgi:imidazolonepropionase-like amidohydrolase
MKCCFMTAAAIITLALARPSPAHAEPASATGGRDLYYGVTILDPATETVRPDSYIMVDHGRIVAIGRGRPANARGATAHDFSGLYALPGLFDTHAHMTLGPLSVAVENGRPRIANNITETITAHYARTLLSFGVTTIRNPGGPAAENRAYVERVARGALPGPEMIYAAEVIDHSPVTVEHLSTQVTPERPIATIVAEQARTGARYVKLYAGLNETEVAEGIRAAHAHNMLAVGHLDNMSWQRAADLGIDALVHMMPTGADLLPADRREAWRTGHRPGAMEYFEWYEAADLDGPEIGHLLRTLARRHIHVDATLAVFQAAFCGNDRALLARDLAFDHSDMIANWRRFHFDTGWQADDYRRAQAVWPRVLRLTRLMYEAGVPMTIGTDLGNPHVAPGIGVAREMALHQQAGIPAWAVLRMATSDAARILGTADRTGRLRPGMEADILFIGADPRPDLNRVADARWVVNNGVLLSPERLRAGE